MFYCTKNPVEGFAAILPGSFLTIMYGFSATGAELFGSMESIKGTSPGLIIYYITIDTKSTVTAAATATVTRPFPLMARIRATITPAAAAMMG